MLQNKYPTAQVIAQSIAFAGVMLICSCGAHGTSRNSEVDLKLASGVGISNWPNVVVAAEDPARRPAIPPSIPGPGPLTTSNRRASSVLEPRCNYGAEYDQMASNRVSVVGDDARLTPRSTPSTPPTLQDNAYAQYAFNIGTSYSGEYSINMCWRSSAPNPANVWLGISNYSTSSWNWFQGSSLTDNFSNDCFLTKTFTPNLNNYISPGGYLYIVVLLDVGQAADDLAVVRVGANVAPFASLEANLADQDPADPVAAVPPFTVYFDAGKTEDVDIAIATVDPGLMGPSTMRYEWDYDGDEGFVDNGTQDTRSFEYEDFGLYDAAVKAIDPYDATDITEVTVIGNEPPDACSVNDPDPATGQEPLEVDFDASCSSDPNDSVVFYQWDWDGDGDFDTELLETPEAAYTFAAGVYDVELTVTDSYGASTTEHVATVTAYCGDRGQGDWHQFCGNALHNCRSGITGPSGAGTEIVFENDDSSGAAYGPVFDDLGGYYIVHSSGSWLEAYDLNGVTRWAITNGASGFVGYPAVSEEGFIYVIAQVSSTYYLKSYDCEGAEVDSVALGNAPGSFASIALGGDHVYVTRVDGQLRAYELDLSFEWSYSPPTGFLQGTPAIDANGDLYVGSHSSSGKLYSIDSTGSLNWAISTSDDISESSPAIADSGTVYVVNDEPRLYSINPSGSGSVNWSRAIDTVAGSTHNQIAISSTGNIYLGDDDDLLSLDASNNSRWTYDLSAECLNPIIDGAGRIFVGPETSLIVYGFSDGGTSATLLWDVEANEALTGTNQNLNTMPAMAENGEVIFMKGSVHRAMDD